LKVEIRKPANRQHHGNLKEALILAGMQILEEDGLRGLTLRKCAARAGVSHAAPAHHFKGLPGLKSAIATRGYSVFEQMMREGMAEAEPDRVDRVKGVCLGYIRFATEHEALFNLVFAKPDSFPPDAERQAAAVRARQVLTDVCAGLVHGEGGSGTTEVAVWALAHGFAKLIEIGRVAPGSGDGRDVSFEDIFPVLDLEEREARGQHDRD